MKLFEVLGDELRTVIRDDTGPRFRVKFLCSLHDDLDGSRSAPSPSDAASGRIPSLPACSTFAASSCVVSFTLLGERLLHFQLNRNSVLAPRSSLLPSKRLMNRRVPTAAEIVIRDQTCAGADSASSYEAAIQSILRIGRGYSAIQKSPRRQAVRSPQSSRIRLIGEPGGTRTRDPLIKSQMLYRLSYRPFAVAKKGRSTTMRPAP